MSIEEVDKALENLHNTNWKWNSAEDINTYEDDQDTYEMSKSEEAITSAVVMLVTIVFLTFLICLCCPFCLLAKYRRRRGHIYSQAQAPVTAQTITVTHGGTGTPAIAINNTQRPNNSYPVQQSVTVVPLLNPQSQPPIAQYPQGVSRGQAPGPYPHYGNVPSPYHGQSPMPMPNDDLPPPYPGLPREADSGNGNIPQPAYNPYYDGIGRESNQANSAAPHYPKKY